MRFVLSVKLYPFLILLPFCFFVIIANRTENFEVILRIIIEAAAGETKIMLALKFDRLIFK